MKRKSESAPSWIRVEGRRQIRARETVRDATAARLHGGKRGEVIVVAEAQLLGVGCVVLVDDGHEAET